MLHSVSQDINISKCVSWQVRLNVTVKAKSLFLSVLRSLATCPLSNSIFSTSVVPPSICECDF